MSDYTVHESPTAKRTIYFYVLLCLDDYTFTD